MLALTCAVLSLLPASAASAASNVEKGFWGPTSVNGVSQFPIYRDLGVRIFQTGLSWTDVAPSRPAHPRDPRDPAYRWSTQLDATIAEATRNHMRVLVLLNGTPPWANGGRAPQYAPDNPRSFGDFARAAATRYPQVHLWMIWGEPDRSGNFLPIVPQKTLGHALTPRQAAAPKRYARLLDAAYGQIKAVNRRNLVIGGNTYTTGDIRPLRWIQNMKLPNGRPPRMDLYGHNPFSYRGPDLKKPPAGLEIVDFSDLGRFSKSVQRYLGRPRHKHLRFFLSEFTIPTDAPDLEFNFFVTRALQARWIRDAFRVARQLDVYALGWIHLYDDPPRADGGPVVRGGLMTFDGKKKPGYFAFKRG